MDIGHVGGIPNLFERACLPLTGSFAQHLSFCCFSFKCVDDDSRSTEPNFTDIGWHGKAEWARTSNKPSENRQHCFTGYLINSVTGLLQKM